MVRCVGGSVAVVVVVVGWAEWEDRSSGGRILKTDIDKQERWVVVAEFSVRAVLVLVEVLALREEVYRNDERSHHRRPSPPPRL